MRKISVVTSTRAEYGLLYWIIKDIHMDPALELQLIVTGMHLSPEFGLTVREISSDGFPIAERIKMPLTDDAATAIAQAMGIEMIGFAKAYKRLRPDILVVSGDRFEILPAVSASVPFRIPVAHIHGGELTEGAIDDPIRHAITKMSHLHFVSMEVYRRRIIQMGELPERVFCFGAPGIDNIRRLDLLDKDKISCELRLPKDKRVGMVTYHPVTIGDEPVEVQVKELLNAVRGFENIFWIFTLPNADTGSRAITKKIKDFVSSHPDKGNVFASLGRLRYLSLLKIAQVMVGNSSSGLIEAPSFELPVVNIGDRQSGRVRAKNIIDVARCEAAAIAQAIEKAISPNFKNSLKGMKNPYGKGGASEKIVEKIKTIPLGMDLVKKRFYDLPEENLSIKRSL